MKMKNKLCSRILITAMIFIAFISFTLTYYPAASAQAQKQGVNVSISPRSISLQSTSTETQRTFEIIIENRQNVTDTFEIFISGSYPYLDKVQLSSKTVTLLPGNKTNIRMDVGIPKNPAPGNHTITISVISKSEKEIWNSDTAIIRILYNSKQSYFHEQPELQDTYFTTSTRQLGINYYGNVRLIDRGYIIDNYGDACVGSKMKIDSNSFSGEWFSKGGPHDSPPIEWVEDLEEVKRKIEQGIFDTKVYDGIICSWRSVAERDTGPERCVVRGSLICSSKSCNVGALSSAVEYNSNLNEITILNEGTHEIDYNCDIECIFFINRKNMTYSVKMLSDFYGYLKLNGTLRSLKEKIVLNAERGQRGPDLEIVSYNINPKEIKEGEKFYIKLKVKNNGDMEAKLDNLSLNLKNYEIIYGPKSIAPGEIKEIMIKARGESVASLQSEVKYRSDSIGCLPTTSFKESFRIGELKITGKLKRCSTNFDCAANEVCCEGYCMDTTKGVCDDLDGDGTSETWLSYQ